MAQMPGRRLQFGVAVIGQKLYAVGTRDGFKTLNTVRYIFLIFNFNDKKCTELVSRCVAGKISSTKS